MRIRISWVNIQLRLPFLLYSIDRILMNWRIKKQFQGWTDIWNKSQIPEHISHFWFTFDLFSFTHGERSGLNSPSVLVIFVIPDCQCMISVFFVDIQEAVENILVRVKLHREAQHPMNLYVQVNVTYTLNRHSLYLAELNINQGYRDIIGHLSPL